MPKKILIIDDDTNFRESTKEFLEVQDFQVISCSTGSEGFEKAKADKPDGILLDVMIEDMSTGLGIAKKLRDDAETSNIPVIILTGIKQANQLLNSYAPGEGFPNVKSSLEKPVEPDLLLKMIRNAVD